MERMGRKIENAIRYKLSTRLPFKVSLCVYHKFGNTEISISQEEKDTDLLKIRTSNHLKLVGDNISHTVKDLIEYYKINKEKGLEIHQGRSQINLEDIESIRLDFHKVNSLGARRFIESPKYIKNKKCAINPKNKKDNMCFKYAIVIAIHRNEMSKIDPGAVDKKTKEFCEKYNWNDISFPPSSRDYDIFEENNKHVALVIFEYEDDD